MIFNKDNTNHKEAETPLFLGQKLGVHDTINVKHPYLEQLFAQLKSIDWVEDEVNLDRDRLQFETCPKHIRDIMIKNLAFQAELDSIASRSAGVLIAPFVSNSELWRLDLKIAENECLTPDHEVLTPTGWVKISSVTEDTDVAQYDVYKELASFVKPTAIIQKDYNGIMYHFNNIQNNLSQMVTPKHRMVKMHETTGEVVIELAETLNFKQRNKGRFKTFISGNINGTTKNLTDLERFYIAVQADGYVSDRYTGDLCGTIPVWFGLTKERKCTRLKLLCDSLGFEMIELTGRKENGNVKAQRKFKVNVPLEYCLDFKNFYWVNLKDKDSNWCKEFILEITKWDGSVIKGLPHMSTTNKDVAEKIQAIGFLAGYQTHYRINVDNRSEKFSDCHIIRFNPVKYLDGQCIKKQEVNYSGKVYCISVPTSFFIVRHNGAVSITGNCLHSATYTHIIKMCLKDTNEFFDEVYKNEQILGRAEKVSEVFNEIQELGAYYTLHGFGSYREDLFEETLIKYWVAMYALERIQFMSSFAATFALAEQDWFLGIASLVQKILKDELSIHVKRAKYVVDVLKKEFSESFNNILPELKQIVDEVLETEYTWSHYLFQEGRQIVGFNENLSKQWVNYSAQEVYETLGFELSFEKITESPLPFMDKWINIDKMQTAAQETQLTNYKLNSWIDDIAEDYKFNWEK